MGGELTMAKKRGFSPFKALLFLFLILGIGFALFLWNNPERRNNVFLFLHHHTLAKMSDAVKMGIVSSRIDQSLEESVFGVDMSHYQGDINWGQFRNITTAVPASFVILRATMGSDSRDRHFKKYWKQARQRGIVCGAYHFFRPDEPGLLQAQNFIRHVRLKAGDLPPVVDVEHEPKKTTISKMVAELQVFVDAVEKQYGVKPIIYSGDWFYRTHLSSGQFDDYPVWIANYNFLWKPKNKKWIIWQFTDTGRIEGVDEMVDLNVFRGTRAQFDSVRIH